MFLGKRKESQKEGLRHGGNTKQTTMWTVGKTKQILPVKDISNVV